jgi:hypothetical protein
MTGACPWVWEREWKEELCGLSSLEVNKYVDVTLLGTAE